MILTAIVSEAWRNVSSNAVRTLVVALSVLAIAVSLAGMAGQSTLALISRSYDFQRTGASTFLASSTGAVDGASCDSLERSSDVVSSGALRPSDTVSHPLAAPGFTIPTFEATPGFLELLGVGSPASGVVVSEQLAQQLDVRVGDILTLTDGSTLNVSAVYEFPEDGRQSALAYAALFPAPRSGAFDQCWTRVWPVSESTRQAPLLAIAQPQDSSPELVQLNTKFGAEFSGRSDYEDRVTRWTPVGILMAVTAIYLMSTLLRRVTIASDLHAGMRRIDATAIALLEGVATSAPALAAMFALNAIFTADASAIDRQAVSQEQMVCALAVAAGMALGSVVGVSVTRERRLFTYFTQR
ncbi:MULTISPECIES: hypothetical protein [unclassified Microbacterium]|uniref:hypothetical protein n=1 Tax=unclassified Microbacterium TaxID=2609290 RepID=UPI00344121A9